MCFCQRLRAATQKKLDQHGDVGETIGFAEDADSAVSSR